MMRQAGITLFLLALAAPVAAQQRAVPAPEPVPLPVPVPAPSPPATPPVERPDAARLAAASRLMTLMVPPGFMAEAMPELLPDNDTILALVATEMGIETGGMSREQRARAVEEQGVRRDRNFRERFRIMMDVTRRTATALIAEMEPDMRRVMATLYARQFSVAEMDEMYAFFSTPTGRRYARVALSLSRDPAWQEMFALMAPRMMEAQRQIQAAVSAATAHLDPVPQS
jgi:hypothetical protein